MINYRAKSRIKLVLLACLLFFGIVSIQAQRENFKIFIKKNNTTIKEAFQEIENQTGKSIAYNQSKLDENQKITLDGKNNSLGDILNTILQGTGFSYEMKDDQIMIVSQKGTQQQSKINVKGIITDEKNETIVGASVSVKGSTVGTQTDVDGKFELPISIGQTLRISYIGFHSQEILIKNGATLSITLKEDSKQLDDVVITALGIKREEKALSYNVQKITNEDLTTVKNVNFMNSLVGKVAGAQISTSSAGPGSAAKVILRGAKSVSLSNNALYVIDGVPMNNSTMSRTNQDESAVTSSATTDAAADINPDDIESISVLTGPSAAALYGYEGANGVILITTKKGKVGQTSINYSHSSTFSSPFKMPEFQNKYGNVKGSPLSWGDATDYTYDPKKFFNTGTNIINSLSLSTGNEKNQTYISLSANNATGILPNNNYERYNFSLRNTAKFFHDKLTLDAGFNYIIQENKNMTSQGKYFNPLPALYLFPRGEDFSEVQLYERYDQAKEVNTQYWPYGAQGLDMQNPYWIMHRMNREAKRKRYMISASLQYNITDWLNIVGRINVDNTNSRATHKRYAGTLETFAGPKGRYRIELQNESQTYGDIIANLNKAVGKFSFHVNAGASLKDRRMDFDSTEGDLDKITNWFTRENTNPAGYFKIDDDGLKHQVNSIFANAEIGYNNYLYLTLTGRNDWDSALEASLSKERSFFYPSVGLSALFSEIITLPSWFTYLKGRASYTSVGKSYEPYLTREFYYYDSQTRQYALAKLEPNWYLKPEITDSYEFGLNMRFLNGDLNFDATYYISDTKNQTHIATLPPGSGYDGKRIQSGNVRNSGIELALGYEHKWGQFSWASNYTFSLNKNKVTSLVKSADGITIDEVLKARLGETGSPELIIREGGSMGDIYAVSDFKRDINGYIHLDNVTQLPSIELIKNTKDYKKIGSILPDYYMGWRNSFSYKGIRLNVLLSGRFGGKVISNTQAVLDRYGVSKSSAQLREAGPIGISGHNVAVKDYLNIIAQGTGASDFYVYNATNIRLQELSLEYSIPRKWINNIANVTVAFVGNNLAMIYCKAPFDPELTPSVSSTFYNGVDYFMQPSLRNIGFSLKFQF